MASTDKPNAPFVSWPNAPQSELPHMQSHMTWGCALHCAVAPAAVPAAVPSAVLEERPGITLGSERFRCPEVSCSSANKFTHCAPPLSGSHIVLLRYQVHARQHALLRVQLAAGTNSLLRRCAA
mmetsp:Transcript_39307/g.87469  ORF Transcript_39307/g.87469 Transcript_39307/m.87469 type:complete len:124 (+) Transcript_39307:50-421(+)